MAQPSRSRTSSTSSFAFPRTSSPTKTPDPTASVPKSNAVKPNAHPYAIKTTSTGVLSRSSSSPHHSTAQHHYVPPSPSPTGQASPTKHPRQSGHRYSRSLTSDLPRPLPVPPSPSASPSPSDDEDDTPRRRNKRADTLPSSTDPESETELQLPEDPKTWSPTQLSAYLSSTLRVKTGDVPAQVARDITAFVREKRITGKAFLRLNEGDLEAYGINQKWRSVLLGASRSLRQNILRGRIWGFGNTPESAYNFPQRADDDDLSSNNANVGRRSRTTSVDSTNGNGRVKGMVASFERSSSEDEDEEGMSGRRSVSPTKNAHNRNSASYSPNKTQRALPSRGTVHDLFSSPSVSAKEEPDTGGEETIKHSSPARLLPYPPMLTPVHTGSGSPFSLQDQAGLYELGYRHAPLPSMPTGSPLTMHQTGSSVHSPGSSLHPTGPSTHSPRSSIIPTGLSPHPTGSSLPRQGSLPRPGSSLPNHPTGSSLPPSIPLGVGGPGQHTRPLPLPPHNGQILVDPPLTPGEQKGVAVTVTDTGSVIHHPRPRVGGLVGFYDVPQDVSAAETEGLDVDVDAVSPAGSVSEPVDKPTSSSTSTNPNSSPDQDPPSSPKPNPDPDQGAETPEPSIADLLLAHPASSQPVSGAEAWELELGETVKRVAGSEGLSQNGKGLGVGGSGVVRTGRGRKVRARVGGSARVKGGEEVKGSEEGELGVQAKGKDEEKDREKTKDEQDNAGDEGGDKKPDLWTVFDLEPPRGKAPPPAPVQEPAEDGVTKPDKAVGDLGLELDSRPSDLEWSQPTLDADLEEPSHSALDLDSHSALDPKPNSNSTLDLNANAHSTFDLDAHRCALETRQEALDQRELGLCARQERIDVLDERVREVHSALGHREGAVEERELGVEERGRAVEGRERAVGEREGIVEEREKVVEEREKAVGEREKALDQRESELEERSKQVEEQRTTLDRLSQDLETRSAQLDKRAQELDLERGDSSHTTPAGPWPISFLRSVVFRVLGDKTPTFLLSPASPSSPSASAATSRRGWEAQREMYLASGRGSYMVLVGIGVCAVVLKVLVRRLGVWGWGVVGRRR